MLLFGTIRNISALKVVIQITVFLPFKTESREKARYKEKHDPLKSFCSNKEALPTQINNYLF